MGPIEDASGRYAGEAFWLQQGVKIVADSHSHITRQAERLTVALAWFWTAYLGYVAIIHTQGSNIGLIASLPLGFLILAYLAATIAQGPATGTFDPRIPEEIMQAHSMSLQRRVFGMRAAYILSTLSALSICYSIMKG